jgi:TRIAD3 protein (E3 ubiquitin-protein ligase RNF216)
MVQCPEAHLFCGTCMTSYASNLLGAHDPNIVCMDQSGCKLAFPMSELSRFLTPKLLDLYNRVKQRKEIEAAGLENLEECPFCEYKVVIENEDEKLFQCENSDCRAVSCRECKKLVRSFLCLLSRAFVNVAWGPGSFTEELQR